MSIVNQMIALYKKYHGAEIVPPYLLEMREGAYHMLENIPKEYHPDEDEDVLPIVFWNGGLDMDDE